MGASPGTVFVIDDDNSVRRALGRLLRSAGLDVCTFASADAFLHAQCEPENACVVADVRMPGMSGLQLQRELRKAGSPLRFIFLTAQDTEDNRDEATRNGSKAFFAKPVDDETLLNAIRQTLAEGSA